MKRTRRQETSIILYFSLYFVLILMLLGYFVFGLIPNIKNIEEMKENTKKMYTEYEKIQKTGIGFQDFRSLTSKEKLNAYLGELVKSVDPQFYNKYFENKTSDKYVTFLDNKSKTITSGETYSDYLQISNKISQVLPVYSEVEITKDQEYLSDFKFIHYIESILTTFNLEHDNEIGISELVLVEEYSNSEQKSKLDTNIYYIPLKLNVEGLKSDILNFLYFIEHVGNIKIQGDSILVDNQNEDLFLYRGNNKIILDGERPSSRLNYNIYENQFIDFESVNFDKYIDEKRARINKSDDLISRVKKNQGNDKYSAEITLRFYVKGVQNIKMLNQIQSYTQYYLNSKTLFEQLKKDTQVNDPKTVFIDDAIQILGEMNKDLKTINQSVSNQEDLVKTLKNTNEYRQVIHKLHGKIGYNYYIISVLNKYDQLLKVEKSKESNSDFMTYLESITPKISGLKKLETESQQQYNQRLNNRDMFIEVLQIETNLQKNR